MFFGKAISSALHSGFSQSIVFQMIVKMRQLLMFTRNAQQQSISDYLPNIWRVRSCSE